MKKFSIVYSDDALEDLDNIFSYIAFHFKEHTTAREMTKKIRNEIRRLISFPEMCESVDWEPWHSMGVRKMPIERYVVYYLPDRTTSRIEIVRIFYGGRDVEHLMNPKGK